MKNANVANKTELQSNVYLLHNEGKNRFRDTSLFLAKSNKAAPISECGFELMKLKTNKLCPG